MLSAALWYNSDQGEELFVVRVCKDGVGSLRSENVVEVIQASVGWLD